MDIYHNEVIAHESVGKWMKIAPLRILSFDIECQGRKGHFPEADKDAVIQIASIVTVQGEDKPRVKAIHVLDDTTPIVGSEVYVHHDERDLLKNWVRLSHVSMLVQCGQTGHSSFSVSRPFPFPLGIF